MKTVERALWGLVLVAMSWQVISLMLYLPPRDYINLVGAVAFGFILRNVI